MRKKEKDSKPKTPKDEETTKKVGKRAGRDKVKIDEKSVDEILPQSTEPSSPDRLAMREELRDLMDAFVDFQKTRVAADHRIRKRQEAWLIRRGAAKLIKTTETTEYGEENKEKLVMLDKDRFESAMQTLSNSPGYSLMRRIALLQAQFEQRVEFEMANIVKLHPLWAWCERVKGVAGITAAQLIGSMNLEVVNRVEQYWALAGLTPDSKKVKGERAHHNPLLKTRILLMSRNVVMKNDPYYRGLYDIKKKYLSMRPDIAMQKEDGGGCVELALECGDGKHHVEYAPLSFTGTTRYCGRCRTERQVSSAEKFVRKGWNAWVDKMAKRWLCKIMASHAFEIIMQAEGRKVPVARHPHIPPKMDDHDEQKAVLERFENYCELVLEAQKKAFDKNMPVVASSKVDVGWKPDKGYRYATAEQN